MIESGLVQFMKTRLLTWLLIVGMLHAFTGCNRNSAPLQSTGQPMTVSFPAVVLADKQLIQSLELTLEFGRVIAINHVPQDWQVELRWSDRYCIGLKCYAGHFSAGLSSVKELDGCVTVLAGHPSKLDIRADLAAEILSLSEATETKNQDAGTFTFSRSELGLKPVSQIKQLQTIAPSVLLAPPEWLGKSEPAPALRHANSDGIYIVRKDDTVELIARSFGLTIRDLVSLNPDWRAAQLLIGQTIKVIRPKP
jgi:LysM domain